jgi:hypothetical protein
MPGSPIAVLLTVTVPGEAVDGLATVLGVEV